MSGAVKTPGGGITTLDFKINRFIGLRGIMLLTSFNKMVVKAPEFTIASTSISKVCSDSSFRLVFFYFLFGFTIALHNSLIYAKYIHEMTSSTH